MSDTSPLSEGIGAYLADIGRYPILTQEAQLLHCRRIHRWVNWPTGRTSAPTSIQRQGKRSMDTMLVTNARLVVSIAKKFNNRGLELPDLIQEGNIGLVRGLELFDPTRGYRVSTYAYWWIRQAMSRAIYIHSRTIRLPINAYDLLAKADRYTAAFLQSHGRPPTTPEIATELDIPLRRLKFVLEAWANTECLSSDVPVGTDDATSLIQHLASPTPEGDGLTPAVDLPTFLENVSNPAHTALALSRLNDEDHQVLHALYFEGRTSRELADELQLTPAKVRQIAARACHRLRTALPPRPQ